MKQTTTNARQKVKKELRKMLRNHFGHSNLTKIKKQLKDNAKYQYGCYHISIKIGKGVEIAYTSNPNHFCDFFFSIAGIGYTGSYAVREKDLTKAGKMRGCTGKSFYIF